MLSYPEINPIAFTIGPLKVHWYGLMYLLAFSSAYLLAIFRIRKYHLAWTKEQVSDLIFYAAVGVIIGGRLGYMFFYDFLQLWHDPIAVFKIWQGGMSFHGGILGVGVAAILFARKSKRTFLSIADFIAPLVPLGLAAGRIGNFINGELWGRVTTLPWAMVFKEAGPEPRHPSQLYEFGLEGIVLFIIIWWYANKPRAEGATISIFLMSYAICRCIVELFREPDRHLGFIAFNWLTMGQLLSIIMFLSGLILFIYTRKKP
ncbi:MAG: prolipoprotein diacylglyceryl transferase [Legionellaceae bacterium]|nr:prolipoprotein diacylglyceryl transferase [Legionellaceae bacterium]